MAVSACKKNEHVDPQLKNYSLGRRAFEFACIASRTRHDKRCNASVEELHEQFARRRDRLQTGVSTTLCCVQPSIVFKFSHYFTSYRACQVPDAICHPALVTATDSQLTGPSAQVRLQDTADAPLNLLVNASTECVNRPRSL